MEEIVSGTMQEIVADLVRGMSAPVVVTTPTTDVLREVTAALFEDATAAGRAEPVRVVATADAVIQLRGRHRDFPLTTRLAELDAQDRVRLTTADPPVPTTKVVGPEQVGVVELQDRAVYGVRGALPDAAHVHEDALRLAEEGEPAEIGAPALSTIRNELATRFSPAVADGFAETFGAVRDPSGPGPDAAKLLLWVGARFDLQYSELRSFAADTGFTSHATLSRRLAEMIDDGVIEAAPVADGTGHPTKRLSTAAGAAHDDSSDFLLHVLS